MLNRVGVGNTAADRQQQARYLWRSPIPITSTVARLRELHLPHGVNHGRFGKMGTGWVDWVCTGTGTDRTIFISDKPASD
jgi:hypothetical protein